MINYYQVLGLRSSASGDEIRRAYRILARRYHPDLNPGNAVAEEKFKAIAQAYAVLSEGERRRLFDLELEAALLRDINRKLKGYAGAAKRATTAAPKQSSGGKVADAKSRKAETPSKDLAASISTAYANLRREVTKLRSKVVRLGTRTKDRLGKKTGTSQNPTKVSLIEVSIDIRAAIRGTKKIIEIAEPEGPRKVQVSIPAGVKTGSVVRLRDAKRQEELVLIVRLAHHPFVSMQTKGVILEVPITINEAISGANISVPTLDGSVFLKIPAGTQSGTEFRLKEKGVRHKDGSRGDLFIRTLIHVPTAEGAVGLVEKSVEFEKYYGDSLRKHLGESLGFE